jgi:hypothetical protein
LVSIKVLRVLSGNVPEDQKHNTDTEKNHYDNHPPVPFRLGRGRSHAQRRIGGWSLHLQFNRSRRIRGLLWSEDGASRLGFDLSAAGATEFVAGWDFNAALGACSFGG